MIKRFASDIINHAMRLAQQQAINQFSFRDILYLLNQHWRYCYERISQIDPGFYSEIRQITERLTHMPPYVMGSINVYSAPDPLGFNRQVYTHCGVKDLISPMTYNISGSDLYCWDIEYRKVWLEYLPQPKPLFFTHHNRDPVIIEERDRPEGYRYEKNADGTFNYDNPLHRDKQDKKFWRYGIYEFVAIADNSDLWTDEEKRWITLIRPELKAYKLPPHTEYDTQIQPYYDAGDDRLKADIKRFKGKRFYLRHMGNPTKLVFDITEALYRGATDEEVFSHELFEIVELIFDFPYAFVTYRHKATGDYHTMILNDLLSLVSKNKYNAFDFTGRNTKVKILDAHYNDDTGMGVIVEDYDDLYEFTYDDGETKILPRIKELGWTPDSIVNYPADCIFDYIVGHMAKRFANKNESTIMDIDHAIGLAEKELSLFLKRDTNPFIRINNVVSPRLSDFL